MYRSPTFLLFMLFFSMQGSHAQSIEGCWLSRDSSRTYQITKEGEFYNCSLVNSTRKGEHKKVGESVLKKMTHYKRGNYYAGQIISLVDGSSAYARIYFDQKKPALLKFKVYHFFGLLSGTIFWKACPEIK